MRTILWGALIGVLAAYGLNANAAGPAPVVLLHGATAFDDALEDGVVTALNRSRSEFPGIQYFAISDARQTDSWIIASVVGLAGPDPRFGWSLEDGLWFGVVLLKQDSAHYATGEVQGTGSFSELLKQVPDNILDAQAKQSLDRSPSDASAAGGGYVFPWQAGASMFYGQLGVHDNGFGGIVSGWKAVDMASDGNAAAGHAPNHLLAAASGSITYKCYDGTSVAVRLGDFFYTHLTDNPNLYVGRTFGKTEELGQLLPGTFNGSCGWTNQSDNWFHVHWGFPNADLLVESWTLSMATQNWIDGTTTISPGDGWIQAAGQSPVHQPAASDFDGDDVSDIAYFRESMGLWAILKSSQNFAYGSPLFFNWGQPDDIAVPGDYDGDDLWDPAVRRPPRGGQSTAYLILKSSAGYDYGSPLVIPAGWPGLGDIPVPGDYNGDGITEPAIWRGNMGVWIVPLSPSFGSYQFYSWGTTGDTPVGADVDGDGWTDIGYWRPSTGVWGFLQSSAGYSYGSPLYFSWGTTGDIAVMADYDGDCKADPAVVIPPTGGQSRAYRILPSSMSYSPGSSLTIPAGWPGLGDTPVPADYDGDGKADAAVWRASTGVWIIPKSSVNNNVYIFASWGAAGDQPAH